MTVNRQTKQTKRASLVESLLNVAIGYGIAVSSQIIVFPWFGVHIPLRDNLLIAVVFTFISIARSFLVRRLFETLRIKEILP